MSLSLRGISVTEFTTALHGILQEYTLADSAAPYFAKVFKGEPNALTPTGQALARWRVKSIGPAPEGPRVLTGEMMRTAVFNVMCVWPLTAMEGRQQGIEDEITEVCVSLPQCLCVPALTAADYTIAGIPVSTITIEDISPVEAGFPVSNPESALARLFQFDVHVRLLEES
jgi:hypothetical protein